MSGAGDQDKRFLGGPRPLGAVLPAVTRAAFRKRAPAGAGLMTDWALIVGPAVAAMAAPLKLSGTTLTLAAPGPAALELQMMAPELIARINGHAGKVLVERLRFAQKALPVTDNRPSWTSRRPSATQPDLGDFPPGPLRDALCALGAWVSVRR